MPPRLKDKASQALSDRRTFLAAMGSATTVGFAGCLGDENGGDDTIKIGMTRATDGWAVHDAEKGHNGMEIWLEEINDRGGVQIGDEQREVELIIRDDRSEVERATRMYEEMITEDEVDALLAPFSSTLTSATAAIAAANDVFMSSWGAASPSIFQQGYDNIISVDEPTTLQGPSQVESMVELLDIDSIALIHEDTEFPASLAEGVENGAEEFGVELVHLEGFPPDIRDFSSVLNEIDGKEPDVFWCVAYGETLITMIRQMRENDITFPWTHTTYSTNTEFHESLEDNSLYFGGQHNIHPDVDRGVTAGHELDEWFELYYDMHDEDPTFNSANGYAGLLALTQCMEEAESANDTEALKEAALDLSGEYTAINGEFSVDETGVRTSQNYVITQNHSLDDNLYDRFEVVDPLSPTADPVYPTPEWGER